MVVLRLPQNLWHDFKVGRVSVDTTFCLSAFTFLRKHDEPVPRTHVGTEDRIHAPTSHCGHGNTETWKYANTTSRKR
jgi:hypothetical protein